MTSLALNPYNQSILTTGSGTLYRYETDFFDIKTSGLYTFDISDTDIFKNVDIENIMVHCIAKVITATGGYEVDDIVYAQYSNYNGNTSNDEIGSAIWIKSSGVLGIKFGNDSSYVSASPNNSYNGSLDKTDVNVKLVLEGYVK